MASRQSRSHEHGNSRRSTGSHGRCFELRHPWSCFSRKHRGGALDARTRARDRNLSRNRGRNLTNPHEFPTVPEAGGAEADLGDSGRSSLVQVLSTVQATQAQSEARTAKRGTQSGLRAGSRAGSRQKPGERYWPSHLRIWPPSMTRAWPLIPPPRSEDSMATT